MVLQPKHDHTPNRRAGYREVGRGVSSQTWDAARVRSYMSVSPSPGQVVQLDASLGRVLAGSIFEVPARSQSATASLASEAQRSRSTYTQTARRAGRLEGLPGAKILETGQTVSPMVVALAAAHGCTEILVYPKPVAVPIITTDRRPESQRDGQPHRDDVEAMIRALVLGSGASAGESVWVPDTASDLADSVGSADASIILVFGRPSGTPRFLYDALNQLEARWIVRRIQSLPGASQALAVLPDGRAVIGFPRDPYEALVGFCTLALPALAKLGGYRLPELREVPAHPLWAPRPALTRLLLATNAGHSLTPLPFASNAPLRGLALAEALAVLTPDGRVRNHPIPSGWPMP
jgi:molybdopterin molybdotransferase